MENLLDELIAIESRAELWQPEVQGSKLWPAIRAGLLSTRIMNKMGWKTIPIAKSSRRNQIKLWRPHLRTLSWMVQHNSQNRYSAFFMTYGLDRFSYYFYERLTQPLIMESSWNGQINAPLWQSSNQVLLEDTFKVWSQLRYRHFPLSATELNAINEFAHQVSIAYEIPDQVAGIANRVKAYLRRMSIMRPVVERIVRQMDSKFALIHMASYMGMLAPMVKLLHEHGITIAEPQHGIATEFHYAYNLPEICVSDPHHVCRQYLPDVFLTHGDYWGSRLRTPSRIVVTGFPRLSEQIENNAGKIEANPKQILIISQFIVIKQLIEITDHLARRFPDHRIIFKLHPLDTTLEPVWASLEQYPNVEIKGLYNIHELIAQSAVIVGYNSTVLWEVLAFPGKRCFFLKSNEIPDSLGQSFSTPGELIDFILNPSSGYASMQAADIWADNWQQRVDNFLKNHVQQLKNRP